MRLQPLTLLRSLLFRYRARLHRIAGKPLPATVIPAQTGLRAGWDLNGIIGNSNYGKPTSGAYPGRQFQFGGIYRF